MTTAAGDDRTHESVVRAQLARGRRQPNEAVHHALAARHSAESMALVAFHFFAMAICDRASAESPFRSSGATQLP